MSPVHKAGATRRPGKQVSGHSGKLEDPQAECISGLCFLGLGMAFNEVIKLMYWPIVSAWFALFGALSSASQL